MKIICPYIHSWALSSGPWVCMSAFMPAPFYFNYSFEIRTCKSSNFAFHFQDYLGYSGPPRLSVNLRIGFLFLKGPSLGFWWDGIESGDCLGVLTPSQRGALQSVNTGCPSGDWSRCSFQRANLSPPWLSVCLSIFFFLLLLPVGLFA